MDFPSTATCLRCGYPLHLLPKHICPECGQCFDPRDPLSFADKHSIRFTRWQRRVRHWRRIGVAPSLPWCVLLVVFTGYLVVATSNPAFLSYTDFTCSEAYRWRILNVLALAVIFFSAFGWARRASARSKLLAQSPRHLPADNRWRSGLVLVCVFMNASLLVPWTLWLRFEISRNALEHAARQQIAKGTGTFDAGWIGLYYVNGIFLHYDGTVVLDTCRVSHLHRDWYHRVGFIFSPNGRAEGTSKSERELTLEWSAGNWADN